MSRSAERDRDVGFSRNFALSCANLEKQEAVAAAVSNTAVILPLVAWFVVLVAGTASYHGGGTATRGGGGAGGARPRLPLEWYDDVFKRAGPLLPLLPLLARWVASFLMGRAEKALPSTVTPSAASPHRALAVYVSVAIVRLVVYLVGRGIGSHAMADHVFLGASVVAAAHAEAVAGAALTVGLLTGLGGGAGGAGGVGGGGMARGSRRGGSGAGGIGGGVAAGGRTSSRVLTVVTTALAAVGTALATCLLALQCGDSYFTAAYFHHPGETLLAAWRGAAMLVLLSCTMV
jgi:hypothetical protein